MPYKNIYKYSIDKNDYFHFHHGANKILGDDREFKLHHHPYSEIYIYISGKAKFLINGTTFQLNPYDIIIVPPYTLHQPQPHIGEFFERLVLNIYPDFFHLMDCTEYQDVFSSLSDLKCKIPGHIVKQSNIFNFITFFKEKYHSNEPYINPLVTCKIIELLYQLNTINNFEKCNSYDKVTQEIIAYVDKNFSSIINVQDITDNFFYSKNHLSHIFKKNTGLTITQYINIKKIENVEKLYKQGRSLISACIESGFKNYDCFAYNYKKEFGASPKKGLSNSIGIHNSNNR